MARAIRSREAIRTLFSDDAWRERVQLLFNRYGVEPRAEDTRLLRNCELLPTQWLNGACSKIERMLMDMLFAAGLREDASGVGSSEEAAALREMEDQREEIDWLRVAWAALSDKARRVQDASWRDLTGGR
jgi:hypothetical protein